VIGRGRLIADTPVRELLRDQRVTVRGPEPARLMTLLAGAGATVVADGDALTVSALSPERIAELAFDGGLRLHELTAHRVTLEDVFMDLTREAVEYR
jgi:ABC-2 type transport system ATP-binding protein